ncbi:MAG: hypothetical protein ACE5H7_08945 [Acidiferrobacterales bacterium]
MRIVLATSLLLALPALIAPPALAGEGGAQENTSERFWLRVGAFAVNKRKVDVRLDSSSGIGIGIDFTDVLGLKESRVVPRVQGLYMFKPKHGISFDWFELDTSGSKTIGREITFGDETFFVGTNVDSLFNLEILKAAYNYRALASDKMVVGLAAGLYLADLDVGIQSSQSGQSENASGTAPLPVLGLRFGAKFAQRWYFITGINFFFLEIDKYRGAMTDFTIGVEHRTFKNVGFGLGWNRFALDLRAEDDNLKGQFQNIFSGWLLSTSVYY